MDKSHITKIKMYLCTPG